MSHRSALFFIDPSTGKESSIGSAIDYLKRELYKVKNSSAESSANLMSLGRLNGNANTLTFATDITNLDIRLAEAERVNIAQDKRLDALEKGIPIVPVTPITLESPTFVTVTAQTETGFTVNATAGVGSNSTLITIGTTPRFVGDIPYIIKSYSLLPSQLPCVVTGLGKFPYPVNYQVIVQAVRTSDGLRNPADVSAPNYATSTVAAAVHPVGGYPAPVISTMVPTPGSTNGSFDIIWTPQAWVAQYLIYVFGTLFTLSSTQTKLTVTPTTATQPYAITIASRDTTTKTLSDWASTSYSTTLADATAVALSNVTATSFTVSFTPGANADSHVVNIYQQGLNTSAFLSARTLAANVNTTTYTGLLGTNTMAVVVVAMKGTTIAPLAGAISTTTPVPNATLVSLAPSALTVGALSPPIAVTYQSALTATTSRGTVTWSKPTIGVDNLVVKIATPTGAAVYNSGNISNAGFAYVADVATGIPGASNIASVTPYYQGVAGTTVTLTFTNPVFGIPLPSTPVGTSITLEVGTGRPTIAWATALASEAVVTYNVIVAPATGAALVQSIISATSPWIMSASFVPLQSTNYTVSLWATNATGSSVAPYTWTYFTPPAKPVLTVSSITTTGALLQWSGVTGATSYTLTNNGVNVANPSNGMTLATSSTASPVVQNLVLTAINSGGPSLPATISYTPLPLVTGYDIILCMGQSNMVGNGTGGIDPAIDTTDPRILMYDPSTNGVTVASDPLVGASRSPVNSVSAASTFARKYLTKISVDRKVIIVMTAVNGTGLYNSSWHPYTATDLYGSPAASTGGAVPSNIGLLFRTAMYRTQNCVAGYPPASIKLGAILWVQGEADAGQAASNYQESLLAMIAKTRSELAPYFSDTSKAPFVMGGMVPDFGGFATAIDAVHKVIPSLTPYSAFVSGPIGMNNPSPDQIHYTCAGYRVLGASMATAYDTAILNTAPLYSLPVAAQTLAFVDTTGNVTVQSAEAFKLYYKCRFTSTASLPTYTYPVFFSTSPYFNPGLTSMVGITLQVAVLTRTGCSDWVTATTPTVPSAPLALTATSTPVPATGTVTLSWALPTVQWNLTAVNLTVDGVAISPGPAATATSYVHTYTSTTARTIPWTVSYTNSLGTGAVSTSSFATAIVVLLTPARYASFLASTAVADATNKIAALTDATGNLRNLTVVAAGREAIKAAALLSTKTPVPPVIQTSALMDSTLTDVSGKRCIPVTGEYTRMFLVLTRAAADYQVNKFYFGSWNQGGHVIVCSAANVGTIYTGSNGGNIQSTMAINMVPNKWYCVFLTCANSPTNATIKNAAWYCNGVKVGTDGTYLAQPFDHIVADPNTCIGGVNGVTGWTPNSDFLECATWGSVLTAAMVTEETNRLATLYGITLN
jgi:Carbohydrate esterase, sialic acid-specific acetylesterase